MDSSNIINIIVNCPHCLLPIIIEQLNNLGVRGQQPVPVNFLAAERRKYTQMLRNATIDK